MQTLVKGHEQSSKISSPAGLTRLLTPGPTLSLHDKSTPDRADIESYIAQQFHKVHGAHIHDFMPILLDIDCCRTPIAALGIRPAGDQDLFLEQYLPRNIESFVSQTAGYSVSRQHITEIGNLVATQRGGSQLLFLILTALLQQSQFDWVVFTATPLVDRMMTRMGMKLHQLYDADPALLTNSHISEWGSYYDSQPKVVTVNVAAAMASLCQRKAYKNIITLYQNRVAELALTLDEMGCHGAHSLSA